MDVCQGAGGKFFADCRDRDRRGCPKSPCSRLASSPATSRGLHHINTCEPMIRFIGKSQLQCRQRFKDDLMHTHKWRFPALVEHTLAVYFACRPATLAFRTRPTRPSPLPLLRHVVGGPGLVGNKITWSLGGPLGFLRRSGESRCGSPAGRRQSGAARALHRWSSYRGPSPRRASCCPRSSWPRAAFACRHCR